MSDESACTVYIMMLIFSLATPLGCMVGLALSGVDAMLTICFSCLAAGTFLYISTTEIIVEEFAVQKYRWVKFFMFLVGAAVISFLTWLE